MRRVAGLRHGQHFQHQLRAAQKAFGARALELQLARHLLPALALLANQVVVWHEDLVKRALAKRLAAQLRLNGANGEAARLRILHVDEELRHAGVPIFAALAGAHQRDHVIGDVGARGPHLAAGDGPAARHLHGLGADGGQVRARIGLAHADAKGHLATHDARHDLRRQHIGRVLDEQGPTLPVGHPVKADRRAGGQQLFEQHVTLEVAEFAAAVALGPEHANPAALGQFLAEGLVLAGPVFGACSLAVGGHFLGQERPHLLAQLLTFGGHAAGGDVQLLHG